MEQPPMGDASSSLPQDPIAMGGEPPMGDMPAEPEPPMDDMGGEAEASGKVKEIMDTANSISEKDQDTLLAYARSLKDASEEAGAGDMGGEMGAEPPMPTAPGQEPMQESVIFTKKQVKHLNENLCAMDDELERDKALGHTTKLKSDKNKPVSPFDPPRKNRK